MKAYDKFKLAYKSYFSQRPRVNQVIKSNSETDSKLDNLFIRMGL